MLSVSKSSFPRVIEVDGGYSAWSMWSMCSATCGEGVKMRSRICNSPTPRKGGKNCASLGSTYETASCNEAECPIGTSKIAFPLHYLVLICFIHQTRLFVILPSSKTYWNLYLRLSYSILSYRSVLPRMPFSDWLRYSLSILFLIVSSPSIEEYDC